MIAKITFDKFTQNDVPLFKKWAKLPHIKNTWFLEGYQTVEEHIEKAFEDEAFIIKEANRPIGYIYFRQDDPNGTYSIDIFIAKTTHLNRGLGTLIIKTFCHRAFENRQVRRIIIDPAKDNLAAIRCYEKVGFKFLRHEDDGVKEKYVMELEHPKLLIYRQPPNDYNPIVEVASCYLECQGRYLFLERSDQVAQPGTWGVPAGKFEEGECPLEAANRELLEETGIENLKLLPLKPLYIRGPEIDFTFHRFRTSLQTFPKVTLSQEHTGYRWVSYSEAKKLPLIFGAEHLLFEMYHHFEPTTPLQLSAWLALEKRQLFDKLKAFGPKFIGPIAEGSCDKSQPIVIQCNEDDSLQSIIQREIPEAIQVPETNLQYRFQLGNFDCIILG
ncbi:MAG: GNAT family N-acetyltransferase [Simkaniaceae bacterium]|nr:GNAT family N-acetyltransferase [Simkaniaceae bacterium]